MARITVVLDVDDDIVKKVSGQENLNDAVHQELGWLHDSGLFVNSVWLHDNIYLKMNENREWSAMVGTESPCEGAVLFVEEQDYPVDIVYYRTDINGSSSMEVDLCRNREELLKSLNWIGACGYVPVQVWDYDMDKCDNRELVDIFHAGVNRRYEIIQEEMDAMMSLDEAIEEASSRQGDRDPGPGAREGIGEYKYSPMNKNGSKTAGRDDDLGR